MSIVRPFTDAHAVASVECGITFASPLPDELLEAMRERAEEGRQFLGARSIELPSGTHVRMLVISSEDDTSEPTSAAELVFSGQSVLGFRFSEYRGWSHLSARISALWRFFEPVLATRDMVVKSVGLEFVDTFIADEPNDGYPIDEIFAVGNRYMPGVVASSVGRWESTVSWLDDAAEFSVHHYLNLTAWPENSAAVEGSNAVDGSEPWRIITEITHRQQTFEPADRLSLDFEWVLDALHMGNKALLTGLLSPELARRIGLEAPK